MFWTVIACHLLSVISSLHEFEALCACLANSTLPLGLILGFHQRLSAFIPKHTSPLGLHLIQQLYFVYSIIYLLKNPYVYKSMSFVFTWS